MVKITFTRASFSKLLLIAALIMLAACEKIELGHSFDAGTGRKYRVSNSLSFTIDSLKDYRCPSDVMCVWSGDVELYFSIHKDFSKVDTTIYLLTRQNNPFRTGGYTFEIKDVLPHLKSGESVKQEDYRINMVITEK